MSEVLKPIVKWVGGKRQLLPPIRHIMAPDAREGTYFEPFFVGGAVFWDLLPARAVVNDLNADLMNLYTVVRDCPEMLVETLGEYRNEPDFYYEIRALDRDPKVFASLSPVERAARMLYLNRAGFNGLYRVNRRGEFNVPFGRHKLLSVDYEAIFMASEYLRTHEVTLLNGDYRDAVAGARCGDFVYLDPPYDPVSATANFTSYGAGGFGREDQRALRDLCVELHEREVRFLLSNSRTDFICELYEDFNVQIVHARRSVNSVSSKRGKVEEVLVCNYEIEERGELCA